jgi:hypothetical protein
LPTLSEAPFGHIDCLSLSDYFTGRLTESQRQVSEEHLAVCDDCISLSRKVLAALTSLDTWTHTRRAPMRKVDSV